MKKIIFGVFPSKIMPAIGAEQTITKLFKDNAIYSGLNQIFKTTVKSAQSSATSLFEYVGLPTETARIYKDIKNRSSDSIREGQTLVAAVVSLDMEEHVRQTFKRMRAHTVATINCP